VDAPEPREARKSDEKPLLEVGKFRTFFAATEPWCINDHTLVQDREGKWHLFGITHEKPFNFDKDPATRLAHATAYSLLQDTWQAQPPAITADWEKYQEWLLWAPHVVRHNNVYHMFVCTGDDDSHNYRIGLLTSPDLKTWTRHPDNPLLIDGFDGRDPMVIHVENQWVLYYTATSTPEGGNHIVVSLTSDDLAHWSNRKVVFVHPHAGTFGGPTESPFVVRRGRHYYLFACDNLFTDVYLSRDPFRWEYDQKVARFEGHACEVVRDERGRWFVTHAGWERGPVKMAPLKWNDDLDETPTSLPPAYRGRN
jgi:sucrose-6-phosphate hydrolase SacC (GH32 family)